MQTIGAIIRAQRTRLGLTLERLANLVGCTKGYLSAVENNRRAGPPSLALLEKIERALALEPGRLVSVWKWHATPNDVRQRVLDLETDRLAAQRLARLLATEGIDRAYRSGELRQLVERLERSSAGGPADVGHPAPWRSVLPLQVPLINKVAAGYPTGFTDLSYPARVADEYVSVPDLADPDAFAARVVGPSMEPEYREGDIVVFSPLAATRNGCDCFVRFEGPPETAESTFKRVYFEKDPLGNFRAVRLQPLNPAFPPRNVEREAIAGMYPAVYVIRGIRGG